MNVFDQLVALLDKSDDEAWGNVWSDEALCLFRQYRSTLVPQILAVWRQWPINRQEHLSFILGSTGASDERSLINDLLTSPNASVLNRAKEALEEWAMSYTPFKRKGSSQ